MKQYDTKLNLNVVIEATDVPTIQHRCAKYQNFSSVSVGVTD